MRILHLTASLDEKVGGPARSVSALADAQARKGHRVMILSAGDGGRMVLPTAARAEQYPPTLGFAAGWSLGVLRRAAQLSRQADVVHVHGLWLQPAWMGLPARRRGAILLVSPRGMLSPSALSQRAVRKRISFSLVEGALLRAADWVIATSDQEQEDILRLDDCLRVQTVPNGIDEVADHALPHAGPTVAFVGRLVPFKRVELLIEALAELPDHRLVVAGDGDEGYLRDLRDLVRARGLGQRVTFSGWVDDEARKRVHQEASALALVSRSENFGMAALEALAAGRPVVVTPSLPWARHQGQGVVAATDDSPGAIATAIRRATAPGGYGVLSARALALAGHFAWPAIADRFDELIGPPPSARSSLVQQGIHP